MPPSHKVLDAWQTWMVRHGHGKHAGKSDADKSRLALVRSHGTVDKILPLLMRNQAFVTNYFDTREGDGAIEPLDTLTALDNLHARIVAGSGGHLEPSLHCQYLYIIFVLDDGKRIAHWVLHEVVGVLGSLRNACLVLQEQSKHKPSLSPGVASLVIHLEIQLSKYLEAIVAAIPLEYNGRLYPQGPFAPVKDRRQDLLRHIRRVDYCLAKGYLPAKQGDIAAILASHRDPGRQSKRGEDKRIITPDDGDWEFELATTCKCGGTRRGSWFYKMK